jgi:two-component system sensor histidine kinase/response regulator
LFRALAVQGEITHNESSCSKRSRTFAAASRHRDSHFRVARAAEHATSPEDIQSMTNLQSPLETSRKLNILLTEDNLVNRVLAQKLLQKFGHSVTLANNGKEGATLWEANQASQFDVILMDIQMPLMDGLAATRVIRAWEAKHESARMPIVALTAHALSGAAAECREAGCDGYLSKPVQRGDLMQTIIRFSASGEVPSNAAGGQAQPTPSPVDAGIRALRPRYLANRGNDIKAMRAALEICDFGAIKRIAHDSKGTGTGYGFPEISALSKILENAAIQSDAAAVAARIAEMEEIVSSSAV